LAKTLLICSAEIIFASSVKYGKLGGRINH
jgi:hypothetical protein